MADIAIIDDWIDIEKIENPTRIRYLSIDNRKIPVGEKSGRYIHSTIITKVLEQYAKDYTILNIVLTYKMNEPRSIIELERAVATCLKESVNIVCMSIGTVWVSEGTYIWQLIRQFNLFFSATGYEGYHG